MRFSITTLALVLIATALAIPYNNLNAHSFPEKHKLDRGIATEQRVPFSASSNDYGRETSETRTENILKASKLVMVNLQFLDRLFNQLVEEGVSRKKIDNALKSIVATLTSASQDEEGDPEEPEDPKPETGCGAEANLCDCDSGLKWASCYDDNCDGKIDRCDPCPC